MQVLGSVVGVVKVQVFVDGEEVDVKLGVDGGWIVELSGVKFWMGRQEEKGELNFEISMVIVIVIGSNGRLIGNMVFV